MNRIRPEEHELRKARRTVEGSLEACKAVREKENLTVALGWTEEGFVKEEMWGVHGYTTSKDRMEIQFNSEVERWKEALEATVAHEFAHTIFFETVPYEETTFNWQYILFEAHSQNFAEKIFPDIETPWREYIEAEELETFWPEVKEIISDEIEQDSELMYGGENFPQWLGYSLAYRIGQELLKDHELEELPELKRSDVVEAGDELFD